MLNKKPVLLPSEQIELLFHVLNSGWITNWGTAIDGGAHIGEWTRIMAGRFNIVHAFEPNPDTFAILRSNIFSDRVVLHQTALLDEAAQVDVFHKKNLNPRGDFVRKVPTGLVRSTTIDQLQVRSCGLIKLDLEGAEYLALLGAIKTLDRCRPVLIVEIDTYGHRYGTTDDDVINFICGVGYQHKLSFGVDRVFIRGDYR